MRVEDAIALAAFIVGMAVIIYLPLRASLRNKPKRRPTNAQEAETSTVVEGDPPPSTMPNRVVPLTTAFIVVSVAVSLIHMMGLAPAALSTLLIADPDSQGFQNVLAGEAWRLITPIFIHFAPLHLLFNMIWL